MALLRIANLSKSYHITKTQKQDVLKGVNIEFKSGNLVALLGESGCGKSTLINILGGLDNDYTGSVVIKGDFIRDFTEKQMDDYRKKRVGLIFQNYNLIPHMTILQNVEIAMAVTDIDKEVREKRAMTLLRLVGLADYAAKHPSQLSGGQKQRVAIARALANNPTILLADEPTGALDQESAAVVMQILQKIAKRGKLVIVVTHSEKVAAQCNRIVRLADGVIVSDTENGEMEVAIARDKEIKPRSMRSGDVAKLAVQNAVENRKRNLLVSVGLAIGMMAVMLILCLSSGLTSYVKSVYADNPSSLQIIALKTNTSITSANIATVEELDGVADVIETHVYMNASYSFTNQYVSGAAAVEGTINKLGAYYEEDNFVPDLLYGSLVDGQILINETFAEELGDGSLIAAVGQTVTVTVNGKTGEFVVSGVYEDTLGEESSANAYLDEDSLKTLSSNWSINALYVTVTDITYVSAVEDDLETLSYTVYRSDDSSDTVLDYIDLGTTVLTAVGGMSMVVSAIVIFIVQYISVTERMKEIGILRAIGARKADIRKMFMFEAGIIGIVGGVLAVVACIVLSIIIDIICYYTLGYFMVAFNVLYYLGGLLVSLLISVLAGISPSMRAAEMDPVEALRAE